VGELEVVFFAPGEEGFELLGLVWVLLVPLVDSLLAAAIDPFTPFAVFTVPFAFMLGRVEGFVLGRLKSGLEGGSCAGGVLRFVFGDVVSVDVVMVVGLFCVGSRVSADWSACADADLTAGLDS
jgi:hypothetical protein